MNTPFFSIADNAPFAAAFAAVQATHPLVDCITNIVTAGDVANGLLAIDARPVMASAPEEIADFVARADALLINLGATTSEQRHAMMRGAAQANALGKPIVIDPVGVGASPLRRQTLSQLLDNYSITAIRGNISEIKALAGLNTEAAGVDAAASDLDEPGAFAAAIRLAQRLARQHRTVIAISGPRDIVSDGTRTYIVNGGTPVMTRVTGSGCTLTGLVAAFCAVCDDALIATTAAIGLLCAAGDQALAQTGEHATASFRVAMFDALSALTPKALQQQLSIQTIKEEPHD